MNKVRVAALAVLALCAALSSYGQTVTGSVSGTIADPSGAVMAGANVTLTNELTNQSREQQTGVSGDFAFTEIVPGTYDVSITKDGFKAYAQHGIVVATSENVALHEISLEIGAQTQEVTVSAAAARVETDNGQRTGLVTTTQMDTIPNSSLNYLNTLSVLPGVTQTTQGSTPTVEGGRIGQAVVQLDGIGFEDNGVQGTGGNYTPNLEAIGEIKVMLSNYDAEYGTRAGGQINVSSKSGTNQFHGSAYWYGRNTWFDSKNYFNTTRGLDRFNNPGYTIGGPIFIPGTKFDASHNKLFFFLGARMAAEYERRDSFLLAAADCCRAQRRFFGGRHYRRICGINCTGDDHVPRQHDRPDSRAGASDRERNNVSRIHTQSSSAVLHECAPAVAQQLRE